MNIVNIYEILHTFMGIANELAHWLLCKDLGMVLLHIALEHILLVTKTAVKRIQCNHLPVQSFTTLHSNFIAQ